VLGDFHLRLPQNFLKMTNAQRAAREEIQYTQAGAVTQAFIDSKQLHTEYIFPKRNM
jgi:hypothetical protein